MNAKTIITDVLLGTTLTIGSAVSRDGQQKPLYSTVATAPIQAAIDPTHLHNEKYEGMEMLIGRAAEGMYANVTATATVSYAPLV
jgi:hypothetical protein